LGFVVKVEAGKEYRSRRGERVLVTGVEPTGTWPVHFVVLDGRYKGVGKRDGSRLMIDGRATAPVQGTFRDHGNDLIEEWPGGAMASQSLLYDAPTDTPPASPTVSRWSSISRPTDGHRRKRSSRQG
jgi:hypothetical protein